MKYQTQWLLSILLGLGALSSQSLAQCEVQKLAASDAGQTDKYGNAVAVDGSTMLVGAWLHNGVEANTGSAYVYDLTAAGWVETAKLEAGDPDLGDAFGWAVALSGDTALVTASGDSEAGPAAGAAYIFERSGGTWTQTQKLFVSNAGGGMWLGNSATMSGDRLIIGARLADAAYVFEKTGGVWLETAKLTASDGAATDWFGVSVSLSEDGETAIVGAYHDDDVCPNDPACNSGSAYIFEHTPGGWVEAAKLTASDAALQDIFGLSVAVSDSRAVVGSTGDDDGGIISGSAYVFERSPGGVWGPNETQKLRASDEAKGDQFGSSVVISGDVIVVGAHSKEFIGVAYLFERGQSGWTESGKFMSSDRSFGDLFGCPVAVAGTTVVIGAWGDDDACPTNGGCNSGSAYVFSTQAPLGQTYCAPSVPNSSGDSAEIHACGSAVVTDGDLVLRATSLPTGQFGYFLGGMTQGFTPSPPGSQGNLCLAGKIGRFAKWVQNSGPSGAFSFFVDITNLPPPLQSAVQPGETWNFQTWFRDKNPGQTSNFTDAVSVTFQ